MMTSPPTRQSKSRNWHTSQLCRWAATHTWLTALPFHLCQIPSQQSASFSQIHTENTASCTNSSQEACCLNQSHPAQCVNQIRIIQLCCCLLQNRHQATVWSDFGIDSRGKVYKHHHYILCWLPITEVCCNVQLHTTQVLKPPLNLSFPLTLQSVCSIYAYHYPQSKYRTTLFVPYSPPLIFVLCWVDSMMFKGSFQPKAFQDYMKLAFGLTAKHLHSSAMYFCASSTNGEPLTLTAVAG